ncbi:MAG: FkbM family methyltransferase [Chlamydiales bacterium]
MHFLSIDTEGGEFEILQNFDFSKCQVDVITVEDNYQTHSFIPFLESRGFAFVTALGQDLIFINKKLNLE